MIPFHFYAEWVPSEARTVVVPAQFESKDAFLAFLGQAIPLPDYFGKNWDALEECLGDLTWLPHPKLEIVHHDIPLDSAPGDQQTYLLILANAVRSSDRFRVVFPEKCRPQILRLLQL